MQASFRGRIFPKVALVSLAAFVGLILSDGNTASAAGTFNPAQTVTLSDYTINADADLTLNLNFAAGDYNYATTVTFTPEDATVAPGPGHPSFNDAAHPDLGDVMGYIRWGTTVGLANNPCGSLLDMQDFAFLNATVDNTHTIEPYTTATAPTEDVDGATGKGTLAIMRKDDDEDGSAGEPEDSNNLPNHVDHYPSFLNEIFTPEGGSPIQPLARYSASMRVDGNAMVLQFLQFDKGALSAFNPPNPLSDLGAVSLGYASVTVYQNPTDVSWRSITDSCSPLDITTTLFGESRDNPCLSGSPPTHCGDFNGINTPCNVFGTGGLPVCSTLTESSEDRYNNPSVTGTHLFRGFHQSQRDLDGDGLENGLDTCPTVATPDYDPRNLGGDPTWDPDYDGVPGKDAGGNTLLPGSGCDQLPLTFDANIDDDLEPQGQKPWQNRGDNCPLVPDPDGDNIECEIEESTPEYKSIPDGGPKGDAMGDLCEGSAQALDCTDAGYVEEQDDVRSNGDFHTIWTQMPVIIHASPSDDSDGDGWSDEDEVALGSDPNSEASTPENFDLYLHLPLTTTGSGDSPARDPNATSSVSHEPIQLCNDGIDNDGDGTADTYGAEAMAPDEGCEPSHVLDSDFPAGDSDGDGWRDTFESFVGTDALGRCQVGRPYGDIPSNDWPLDLHGGSVILDSRNLINVMDFTTLLAPTRYLNTSPGNANYDRRYDLLPGRHVPLLGEWINVQDLVAFLAPVRYLDGPVCTKHPTYQYWE